MAPILQFKRGIAGIGGTVPALRPGEPAFSTNNYDLFVGLDTSVSGNKFFGSHRYWTREDGSTSLKLNLVDKNGSNSLAIKAPNTLANSDTVYTLPAAPTDGYFLKTNANGELSWSSVTSGATFDNVNITNGTLTGLTTITNATIQGGSINNTTIGLTTAAAGAFTTLSANSLNVSGIATVGSLSIGSTQVVSSAFQLQNIQSLDAATKATLEASLALTPNNFDDINVSGIATFQSIANFGAGLNVTAGVSTFANQVNANGGLSVTGQTTLNNNLAVTGVSTFTGAITANGNVTLGSDSSDTLTVNANATFLGTLTGTISTATRAQGVDVTETTSGSEHYVTFVSSSTTAQNQTVRVEGALAYNPTDNALKVAKVRITDVEHTNGTSAITVASNGNVGIAQTLTIEGDLTVKGSTTTVNTTQLKVEDTLIDLGLENSGGTLIPPTTTTVTDVGTVLNYYDTAAKKAAVYWDHTATRVAIAASVTESAGVLTVTDWGTMAAGSILMNGKLTVNDCAGSSDVITCTAGQRFLDNITVDAGTF